MDLREQSRIAMPSCFACRYAGKHIIIWPLEIRREPEQVFMLNREPAWASGSWFAFLDVHEYIDVSGLRMKSKKTEIVACPQHWFALQHDWQQVIIDEVNEYNAYFKWLERTEQ